MRKQLGWIAAQIGPFRYFPQYIVSILAHWQFLLFEASVISVPFSLWYFLGNPSHGAYLIIFVIAAFLAGFFSWTSIYKKLLPKFEIADCRTSRTPWNNEVAIFVQIIPRCLTESPVYRCKATLISVWTMDQDSKWKPTEFDEPDVLTWSKSGAIADEEATLEPRAERRINLCGSFSNQQFQIFSRTGIPRKASDIKIPGKFRFFLAFSATDCSFIYAAVDIQFKNSNWDGLICTLHEGMIEDRSRETISQ